MAFIATCNPDRAKAFYRGTLGRHLVSEDQFAMVFDAAGTMLRVTTVQEVRAVTHTVLGWQVPDIIEKAKKLHEVRVTLERYAGMKQDELGIWNAPGGPNTPESRFNCTFIVRRMHGGRDKGAVVFSGGPPLFPRERCHIRRIS